MHTVHAFEWRALNLSLQYLRSYTRTYSLSLSHTHHGAAVGVQGDEPGRGVQLGACARVIGLIYGYIRMLPLSKKT
jgi:hypothetical protein